MQLLTIKYNNNHIEAIKYATRDADMHSTIVVYMPCIHAMRIYL